MIKIVLKRRKECGTYLATARRHRWGLKMTMKNDRSNVAFSRHCGLHQLQRIYICFMLYDSLFSNNRYILDNYLNVAKTYLELSIKITKFLSKITIVGIKFFFLKTTVHYNIDNLSFLLIF